MHARCQTYAADDIGHEGRCSASERVKVLYPYCVRSYATSLMHALYGDENFRTFTNTTPRNVAPQPDRTEHNELHQVLEKLRDIRIVKFWDIY